MSAETRNHGFGEVIGAVGPSASSREAVLGIWIFTYFGFRVQGPPVAILGPGFGHWVSRVCFGSRWFKGCHGTKNVEPHKPNEVKFVPLQKFTCRLRWAPTRPELLQKVPQPNGSEFSSSTLRSARSRRPRPKMLPRKTSKARRRKRSARGQMIDLNKQRRARNKEPKIRFQQYSCIDPSYRERAHISHN